MELKRFIVYYTQKLEKQITISAEDEPDAWNRFEIGKYNNTFDNSITTNSELSIDFVEEAII